MVSTGSFGLIQEYLTVQHALAALLLAAAACLLRWRGSQTRGGKGDGEPVFAVILG